MWKVNKTTRLLNISQRFLAPHTLVPAYCSRSKLIIIESDPSYSSSCRPFHTLTSDCNSAVVTNSEASSSSSSIKSVIGTTSDVRTTRPFISSNSTVREPSFIIPGTSAAAVAAGLAQGTVTERQILIDDETLHRPELRSWDFTRLDSAAVQMARASHPETAPARSRLSPAEITRLASKFLGEERFSTQASLSHNFGQFQQIISLFLLKVSSIDHPLLHITKIIECEPSHLEENEKNPYHLWRAMMVLLIAEAFGFPPVIASAPSEIHWAIRDKHNLVGKIAEIMWIAHQLHRRVVDVDRLSTHNLSASLQSLNPQETLQFLEDLHKANKATTLIGDLLLTQKCAYLAALKSPIVTELICNSLADYCESEFDLGVRDTNDPQYFTYDSWLSRTELGLGSLLGHCVYSSLVFSGFDSATRRRAFKLGSLLGIMYQAYEDIHFFNRSTLADPSWLDVGILPVVFQAQKNPDILFLPHEKIFQEIKSSSSTLSQALATYEFLKEQTLQELASSHHQLQNPTARDILINFIHSLRPLSSSEC